MLLSLFIDNLSTALTYLRLAKQRYPYVHKMGRKAFSKKEAKKLAAADAWNDLLAANKVQVDEKSNIGYSQGLTISEMIAQVKSQHPIKNEIISSE